MSRLPLSSALPVHLSSDPVLTLPSAPTPLVSGQAVTTSPTGATTPPTHLPRWCCRIFKQAAHPTPPGPENPRARVLITATSLAARRGNRTHPATSADSFHAPPPFQVPSTALSDLARLPQGTDIFLAYGVRPSPSMDRWLVG